MASFGSFETEQEVYSGPEYTVFSARKADDPQTEYAIKVFSIRAPGVDEESAEVLGPLLKNIENTFTERIALQARAAEASSNVAPVFETGRDERGVWYATRFYARSANQLISRKVEINATALKHIVGCIIQGALDVKEACGRSHGEISPMNVQITKADLDEAEVVLSDPLPGSAAEAFRYKKRISGPSASSFTNSSCARGRLTSSGLFCPSRRHPNGRRCLAASLLSGWAFAAACSIGIYRWRTSISKQSLLN